MTGEASIGANVRPARPAATMDVQGAVAGFYLVQVLNCLIGTGALRLLADGLSLHEVAARLTMSDQLLNGAVRFVALASDIFTLETGDGGNYIQISHADGLANVEHMVNLYAGAFGTCVARFDVALRDPLLGASAIDWQRHADAFELGGGSNPFGVRIVAELGVTRVVDIGCGGGQFLSDLARCNPELRGLGIDRNGSLFSGGEILTTDASGRIDFILGDAKNLEAVVPDYWRRDAQVVCARSVMNAFFADPDHPAVADVLRGFRRTFGRALMMIEDYYPKLMQPQPHEGRRFIRTAIHDIAQLASGQGLPPSSFEEWNSIYEALDISVIKAFDYEVDGIQHFIHLIQL